VNHGLRFSISLYGRAAGWQCAVQPAAVDIHSNQKIMLRIEHEDHGENGRFVLYDDGVFAGKITYIRSAEAEITIDHTGVEKQFGGRGYARKLVLRAVEYARENRLKIVPVCSYAKKVIEGDAALHDVLA